MIIYNQSLQFRWSSVSATHHVVAWGRCVPVCNVSSSPTPSLVSIVMRSDYCWSHYISNHIYFITSFDKMIARTRWTFTEYFVWTLKRFSERRSCHNFNATPATPADRIACVLRVDMIQGTFQPLDAWLMCDGIFSVVPRIISIKTSCCVSVL